MGSEAYPISDTVELPLEAFSNGHKSWHFLCVWQRSKSDSCLASLPSPKLATRKLVPGVPALVSCIYHLIPKKQ